MRLHFRKFSLVFLSACLLLVGFADSGIAYERRRSARTIDMHNLGVKQLLAKNYTDAIMVFEKVLAEDPTYDLARVNLSTALSNYAIVLSDKGKYDEAISQLELAVFYNRDNDINIDNLNRMIKYMKLDPNDRDVRVSMAEKAEKEGRLEAAIVNYQAAEKIKSEPETAKKLEELSGKVKFKPAHIATNANTRKFLVYVQGMNRDSLSVEYSIHGGSLVYKAELTLPAGAQPPEKKRDGKSIDLFFQDQSGKVLLSVNLSNFQKGTGSVGELVWKTGGTAPILAGQAGKISSFSATLVDPNSKQKKAM